MWDTSAQVLDAYKYAGQISEGFSNNPFAGGGYEGLEFAVNALDLER